MHKTFAAAAMAASLAAGGLAGVAIGAPGVAGATDPTTPAFDGAVRGAGWVQDALADLVGEETITQEQADAVEAALRDARPDRGPRGLRHLGRGVVAEALGLTQDELHAALADGQTVTEIAEARGIDIQTVVDAVVADLGIRLEERVEAGEMTRERADEVLAEATERASDHLEGDRPAFGGGHRRGGR
ncbi:hypothetical protein NHL50_04920 [Acidimicrobiia bacterium EGI L10123]|uniref:hypothetical protein n=1 Tax=Salinilacustrithrix flava TaxID=2957203 RepID=UPI003D7C20F3|nr:hypothetical protein [Acidimicrobiia bacterium EGI L10123]